MEVVDAASRAWKVHLKRPTEGVVEAPPLSSWQRPIVKGLVGGPKSTANWSSSWIRVWAESWLCPSSLVSSLLLFSRQLCVLCQSITQSRDGRIEAQNRRLSKRSDLSCVGSPSSLYLSLFLSSLSPTLFTLSFSLPPYTPIENQNLLYQFFWWLSRDIET